MGARRRGARPSKARSPRRTASRLVWPVLATVFLLGVLLLAVFPTRLYLNQRSQAEEKRQELEEIEARNAELEEEIGRLEDPAYVELLAREQFGLVFPGEEAYAVVPPPEEPEEAPPADEERLVDVPVARG